MHNSMHTFMQTVMNQDMTVLPLAKSLGRATVQSITTKRDRGKPWYGTRNINRVDILLHLGEGEGVIEVPS